MSDWFTKLKIYLSRWDGLNWTVDVLKREIPLVETLGLVLSESCFSFLNNCGCPGHLAYTSTVQLSPWGVFLSESYIQVWESLQVIILVSICSLCLCTAGKGKGEVAGNSGRFPSLPPYFSKNLAAVVNRLISSNLCPSYFQVLAYLLYCWAIRVQFSKSQCLKCYPTLST